MALQMKIKDLIGDLVRAQIPLQPDPARCAEAAAEAASALGGNAIGLPARAVDQPDKPDESYRVLDLLLMTELQVANGQRT